MATLHLEPARRAAGLVGRVERLGHHALVAGASASSRNARRLARRRRCDARTRSASGQRGASSAAKRSRAGRSRQVIAVEVQHVEENGESGSSALPRRPSTVRPEPPHRVLERQRPAVGANAIASPSRRSLRRQRATASTTSGTRGDVARPRERRRCRPSRWTWMRAPSSLSSTAARRALERVVEVLGGLREHRQERAEQRRGRSRPAPSRRLASAARRPARVAGEHDRATHVRGGKRRGPRDRLHHDAGRARPGAARRRRARRGTALGSVARANSAASSSRRAARARARRSPAMRSKRASTSASASVGGRRAGSGASRAPPSRRRSGPAAARPTGTGPRSAPPPATPAPSARRQPRHLREPRRRRGDLGRRLGDLVQEHGAILPDGARPQPPRAREVELGRERARRGGSSGTPTDTTHMCTTTRPRRSQTRSTYDTTSRSSSATTRNARRLVPGARERHCSDAVDRRVALVARVRGDTTRHPQLRLLAEGRLRLRLRRGTRPCSTPRPWSRRRRPGLRASPVAVSAGEIGVELGADARSGRSSGPASQPSGKSADLETGSPRERAVARANDELRIGRLADDDRRRSPEIGGVTVSLRQPPGAADGAVQGFGSSAT